MHPRRLIGALVALALVLACHAARAGDPREQSRAAFMRGVAQAHQGDYVGARNSFVEAYKLFAHPSILLNLGIARWHTGEYVAAEQDLVHFLSDDGGASADEIASARAALAQSRTHLGTLRIRIEPGGARAKLDAQPIALVPGGPTEVRTTIGPHNLHAWADGYDPVDKSVTVVPDPPAFVSLTLNATPQVTSPPAAGPAPEGPVRSRRRTLVGIGLVSFGVVAAGVGAFAGFEALSFASDYNTRGASHFQHAETKSTGIAFRTTADIAFATAIVTAGAGAYLLFGPPGAWPEKLAAHVLVGPGFAGLAGSF
jgi:hypothetical protein